MKAVVKVVPLQPFAKGPFAATKSESKVITNR